MPGALRAVDPAPPAAPARALGRDRTYVGVVGSGPRLESDGGVASLLRDLGADVRTIGVLDDPRELVEDDDVERGVRARAVVFDADDRLDRAGRCLRRLRAEPAFHHVGTLVVVPRGSVARLDPGWGFDDFVVPPFSPEELYTRIRGLEWRRSEFSSEERYKVGAIVFDPTGAEVTVDGAPVQLTARERALLVFFCEQRGKVLSRAHILERVWGSEYDGRPRTVDIHVRRLRAKLGEAFPLETLRRWGYRLREP